jgi:signal transduction histidine kinase
MLVVATAAMTVLLVLLTLLQFHWVGEVTVAARERIRRELGNAADRIADDFDREVFRAFVAFQPPRDAAQPLAEALADGWERWSATALEPRLIEAVYVVDADSTGADTGSGLSKLDPISRTLVPAAWPAELANLADRFANDRLATSRPPFGSRDSTAHSRGSHGPVFASAPALVLPQRRPARSGRSGEREAAEARGPVIVALDRDVISQSVLPALIELHLGSENQETDAWVLDRGRRGDPVFATGPLDDRARHPDSDVAVRPMLGLRFYPELRAQGFKPFFDEPEARQRLDSSRRSPPPRTGAGGRGTSWGGGPPDSGSWALVLARREGALDAAVARLRRRNLGVGLAVIALLGATSALLLLSARRAQSLARREMELIAGITHELRTPLASIASAAENLADGVVREPEQIRRYGGLIKGETHRLGALVAQVLDFAGSAATGRRARPVEPVDLGQIVDRVIEDHRFTIDEKGFVIDRRQSVHTSRALAEPDALRRALDNVIGNALKYGEAGRWLGIEIEPAPSGDDGRARVALRVRDRGPGIARSDRRRVFEPFYRGPDAAGLHLHGTGLGLAVTKSVVESLGGTIEIEDGDAGRGVTFVITLLAAPPEPAPDAAPIEAAPQAASAPRTAS